MSKNSREDFRRLILNKAPSMKKRLIRHLIKQVVVDEKGLTIFMHLADGFAVPSKHLQLNRFAAPEKLHNNVYYLSKKVAGDEPKPSVLSSSNGGIGDLTRSLDERLYPIDFLPYFFKFGTRFLPEDVNISVEKYKSGCSIRDIAILLGSSKSRVRRELLKAGIKLRSVNARVGKARKIKSCRTSAQPYFGFCYSEGKLVKDSREFPILQIIHRKWSQGKTAYQIELELDKERVRSRSGKKWSWAGVRNTIARFESGKVKILKGGKYELK